MIEGSLSCGLFKVMMEEGMIKVKGTEIHKIHSKIRLYSSPVLLKLYSATH
jgi:hypothetical protein